MVYLNKCVLTITLEFLKLIQEYGIRHYFTICRKSILEESLKIPIPLVEFSQFSAQQDLK